MSADRLRSPLRFRRAGPAASSSPAPSPTDDGQPAASPPDGQVAAAGNGHRSGSTVSTGAAAAEHPPPFPLPPLTTRAWGEESLARATEILVLSDWLENLPEQERHPLRPAADRALDAAIRGHVAAAREAAQDGAGGGRWRLRRRTDARLARASVNLDAAEVDLLRRAPLTYLRGQLPSLDAHVRRHLPRDDPRRLRVKQIAQDDRNGLLDERARESLIGAVRAASSAAEREQRRVRSFCRIVWVATGVLFALALLVGLLGVFRPHYVSLCFQPQQLQELVCPTAQSPLAQNGRALDVDLVVRTTVSRADVPLVEFVGMVAAAVTGAAALRHIRGTSTPFGVPVALTVLKLPTGALTAFLGLLLMRGGFVPGLTALDNTPQVIAWAVVFGASQQLVTGLVDRQAQNVLDSVGNKAYEPTGRS